MVGIPSLLVFVRLYGRLLTDHPRAVRGNEDSYIESCLPGNPRMPETLIILLAENKIPEDRISIMKRCLYYRNSEDTPFVRIALLTWL